MAHVTISSLLVVSPLCLVHTGGQDSEMFILKAQIVNILGCGLCCNYLAWKQPQARCEWMVQLYGSIAPRTKTVGWMWPAGCSLLESSSYSRALTISLCFSSVHKSWTQNALPPLLALSLCSAVAGQPHPLMFSAPLCFPLHSFAVCFL